MVEEKMGEAKIKEEQFLKRINLWVAVLAGTTTLIVGAYNIKNIFFTKEKPPKEPERVAISSNNFSSNNSDQIKSAVEEVGAAWIKKLASPKKDD